MNLFQTFNFVVYRHSSCPVQCVFFYIERYFYLFKLWISLKAEHRCNYIIYVFSHIYQSKLQHVVVNIVRKKHCC